jgi:aerobic carbon-monoxide dehydrogenase large subunit
MTDTAGGDLHLTKFGIGQSVPRNEDPRLLRGRGRYTDDIRLEGQLYAWVRRADVGHGRLVGIESGAAREVPGVHAIVTAADLDAAGYGALLCTMPLKHRDGSPLTCPPRPPLARDRILYVGEPVAVVIADTVQAAKDAAELIDIETESLPAVVDPEAALAPGAPQLHPEAPGNLSLDWGAGDEAAVEQAFARAAHVTRLRLVNNRVVVAAMEPRGAVAEFDAATGRFTLHVGCQGVFGMRASLADVMQVPVEQVHVLSQDVGGSFGMKAPVYPEYVAILHAARTLGRPVRWVDERSGSFLSDQHGRDSVFDASLALDEAGNFMAVRVDVAANMGGWLTHVGPMIQSLNIQKNTPGAYRTPLLYVRSRCAFTNTMPIGAYRGAGRPEGVYIMERLIDQAARELGREPVDLRRQNFVRPDEMPFKSASGMTIDSGDFPAVFDAALAKADQAGFAARRREAEARGRLRGMGVTYYLEVTAGPGREMGGVRFEPSGRVTILTGTLDYGQGHWTPFAQVLSEQLGVPFELIDLVQKDSDQLIAGGGTGGSRSIMASGKAIVEASQEVVRKGRELAGHVLEAAPVDIRFENGRFSVAGTDRGIGILALAAKLRAMPERPEGLPDSLDAAMAMDSPESAFPNGCHVAEVEIDPSTGTVELVRYSAVNDFGTLVNPMLVEGQVHGGVVQGIGQALLERTVYDEDGQLLTGSFMDYSLPRATDLTAFDVGFNPVPATTNPLGAKGCGEAGVAGSMPTIMNAVLDALAPLGITHLDMPATPEKVWQAIEAARDGRLAAE